MAKLTKYVIT